MTGEPGTFRIVDGWRASHAPRPIEFKFDAVEAAYVQLRSESSYLTVNRLEAWTPGTDGGGIVSLPQNGGAVLNPAPYGAATAAIDAAPGTLWGQTGAAWGAPAVGPHSLVVDLPGTEAILVDRVSVDVGRRVNHVTDAIVDWIAATLPTQPERDAFVADWRSAGPRTVEIAVSETTSGASEFRTVFTGQVPRAFGENAPTFWVPLLPTSARYVRLTVLDNHGGPPGTVLLDSFRVYSPQSGGERVTFQARTEAGAAPVTSVQWTLSDGRTASGTTPSFELEPGTHTVNLSVLDANGIGATNSIQYVALTPTVPALMLSPANEAETSVNAEDVTSYGTRVPVLRDWVGSWEEDDALCGGALPSPNVSENLFEANFVYNLACLYPTASVIHQLEVAVTDQHLLVGTSKQSYRFLRNNPACHPAYYPYRPTFLNQPRRRALVGATYTYVPEVLGQPGPPVPVALSSGPTGMTFNPVNGELTWVPGPADVGVHQVILGAGTGVYIDGGYDSASLIYSITVVGAPSSPQILSQPSPTVDEGETYRYHLVATDADQGDLLSYAKLTGPALGTINDLGVLTWQPGHADTGPNPFILEVRDSAGHTAVQTFSVNVAPVNAEPFLASLPSAQAFVGQSYSQQLDTEDDAPNEPLTHVLVSGPSGLAVSTAGLVSWTPNAGQLGPHLIRVQVTDQESASAVVEFNVNVYDGNGANAAPQISSAALPPAEENLSYAFDVVGFDPDLGDSVTWTVHQGPSGLSIGPSTGRLTWTPGSTQVGSHPVVLRLTDGAGLYDDQSYSLAVSARPEPPAFTSAPPTEAVIGLAMQYAPTASDPNGQPVTFHLQAGPAGMSVNQGVVTWTPTPAQSGPHSVQLLARDPGGLESTQAFTIQARGFPQAPVFTTPPVSEAIYVGELMRRPVGVSDPDPYDLVSVSVQSGPSGLALDASSGTVNWTPLATHTPQQTFVLRATDRALNVTLQGSSVVVRGFNPPAFTSVPIVSARPDQPYRYPVAASDPDQGDVVSVTLASGPSGMAFAASALEWTPTGANVGNHTVVLEARDLRGAVARQSFTISVQYNQAPWFTGTPPGSVEAGAPYGYQVLVQDDGPLPLLVELVQAPPGMSLSGSHVLSWTPEAGDTGLHDVLVRATDGAGLASDLSFSIIVRPSASGPAVPSNSYCSGVLAWPSASAQLESEVLAVVNQYRAQGAYCGSNGWFAPAPPLAFEPALRCAARVHSMDMATRGYFAHINPEGQSVAARATLAGYVAALTGENLAAGPATAIDAVEAWLASDVHCANLMDPQWQATGLGYHASSGAYANLHTQVFGGASTGNRAPRFYAAVPKVVMVGDRVGFQLGATDPEGETLTYAKVTGPSSLSVTANGYVRWLPNLGDLGQHAVAVRATDASGAIAGKTYPITVVARSLPPDPSTIAPPLPAHEIPAFLDQVAFLWRSVPPVQHGFDETAVAKDRTAVVRGEVRARNGAGLSGVRVGVADHPEAGFTLTRSDGRFDLAVPGGGRTTLEFSLDGYVPAERSLEVAWADFVEAPSLAMVPYDASTTAVAFGAGPHLARSTPVADSDGARRPTVLFKSGTTATARLPDGTTTPLPVGTVRLTELTVGADGLDAMPAVLPQGTGYTFAAELSIDEAEALGATGVEFSTPVPLYVENFLDFPVGGKVPLGYYDRELGTWVPEDDGRVVEILSIVGGVATIDGDGDGDADSTSELATLGVDLEERQQLGQVYSEGDTLWRVRLPHFSTVDLNWPIACVGSCGVPNPPRMIIDQNVEDDVERCGSIIETQDQTLGERTGIIGTGLQLNYRSDRVPGRRNAYTAEIPVSGSSVPTGATAIRLAVSTAGKHEEFLLPATPNQTFSYLWDGKDAYGRFVLGRRNVSARVAWDYASAYNVPDFGERTFGLPGQENNGAQLELRPARREVSIWAARQVGLLGTLDARAAGFGGWTLSAHHMLDPSNGTVYFGDGTQRVLPSRGPRAELPAFDFPRHISAGSDGYVYVADSGAHVVRRVDPGSGSSVVVAGTGSAGFSGDGGAATSAQLNGAMGVAVDANGVVYIADTENHRIRRVALDGTISTVAGTGQAGFNGDASLAPLAQFNRPVSIAVGPDGSLYVADYNNGRIRRVWPGSTVGGFGLVITSVGGMAPFATQYATEGLFGHQVLLTNQRPIDLAVNSRGELHFILENREASFRLRDNGQIEELSGCETIVGGTGSLGPNGEGSCDDPVAGPDGCYAYRLCGAPRGLAVDGDDLLLTVDAYYHGFARPSTAYRITPDKVVHIAAGGSNPSWSGLGPRTMPIDLANCATDIAVGSDGRLHVSDGCGGGDGHLWSLGGARSTGGPVDVVATDGASLFRFSPSGRHLATVDTLTGEEVLSFGYSSGGYLTTLTDAFSNTTVIQRAASVPGRIVGPFGQETVLTLNPSGYLTSIQDQVGAIDSYGYDNTGLLTSHTDPAGYTGTRTYDSAGRLLRDQDPAGGFQTLDRTRLSTGCEIEHVTGLGRRTVHEIVQNPDGTGVRTVVAPDGSRSSIETNAAGMTEAISADGVVSTTKRGPDPRFGMDAPIIVEASTRMPSGLQVRLDRATSVTLEDPSDPLSLGTHQTVLTVNGRTSTTTYAAATRTLTTRSPAGRQTETEMDAHGRPIELRVPGLLPIVYRYDSAGRPYETQQGTRVTRTRFSAAGWVSEVEDALGRVTSLTSDEVGRPVSSVSTDGRAAAFAYDVRGNRTSVTPPSRSAHEYVYDARNLETEYRPPPLASGVGTPLESEYNLDRSPTLTALADTRTIEYIYQPSGRIDHVVTPDGDIVYDYEPLTGALASISSPSGVLTTYTRDGSLITDVAYGGLFVASVHYTYDNDFRLVSETVNGGAAITVDYDPDGFNTRVGVLSLQPDPDNGLLVSTAVGVVGDSRVYNGYGELVGYDAQVAAVPLYTRDDERDNLGRIVRSTEMVGGVSTVFEYQFDLGGRLEVVWRNSVAQSSYSYDGNGNRSAVTDLAGTRTATVDAQDRLLAFGDFTYSYNDMGQLQSRVQVATSAQTSYTHDTLGNLLSVDDLEGDRIDYAIDGGGRRVGRWVNGVLEDVFVWSAGRLAASVDSGGQVTRFVYATGDLAPDYFSRGGTAYRLLKDARGSVRLVVDANDGSIAQRLEYGPFGEVESDTNPGFQPFGFAGGLYDSRTNLVRFGARDYDPYSGRWTSRDPVQFAGGDSNLYTYVANDPINRVDPTGLYIESAWDIANVGIGVYSFLKNIDCGNFWSAAFDGVGIVIDSAAVVLPIVPGGAGTLLKSLRYADEAAAARGALNWSWKSTKTFGHTFKTHGAGAKNAKSLLDRARTAGQSPNQGQWLDNEAAAEFLKGVVVDGPATVRIPEGLGQVIHADGTTSAAIWAVVAPDGAGGFISAFPFVP
ncbi:MAG: putative Ig domain-containing protein [Deltaproteobacteria bacterium]|nr:putative Ig domain-containing protein [Deltaproteobacteria bacterium]